MQRRVEIGRCNLCDGDCMELATAEMKGPRYIAHCLVSGKNEEPFGQNQTKTGNIVDRELSQDDIQAKHAWRGCTMNCWMSCVTDRDH